MNINIFSGRLAHAIELKKHADTDVVKFTLIHNEYAGKDNAGASKERKVAVQFTAFGKRATALSSHANIGDQLFVNYRIENNNFEKEGETIYGYNFILEEFEFGAPGAVSRSMQDK